MAKGTPHVDTSFLGWSMILETKLNDGCRHWRPSWWGKDAGETRHWRLSSWGVAMTLETKQVGIGDVAGDLVAGEWK